MESINTVSFYLGAKFNILLRDPPSPLSVYRHNCIHDSIAPLSAYQQSCNTVPSYLCECTVPLQPVPDIPVE